MHRTMNTPVLLAGGLFTIGLLAVGQAAGIPATLTIDPAQSSIDIDSTLITTVGDETATASSPISGTIELDLDTLSNPSSIAIVDFNIVFDNDIVLDFDYGLAGAANATLSSAGVEYGLDGGITGPILAPAGLFDFPAVPSSLTGTLDASYKLLLLGNNAVTLDLADFGLFEAPLSGVIRGDGTTVTLNASYLFEALQTIVPEIASLQINGSATIVAIGENPNTEGCNMADIVRPFGVIDLADINAFTAAFTSENEIADIAEPFGVFDLNDVSAFINDFNAGCP